MFNFTSDDSPTSGLRNNGKPKKTKEQRGPRKRRGKDNQSVSINNQDSSARLNTNHDGYVEVSSTSELSSLSLPTSPNRIVIPPSISSTAFRRTPKHSIANGLSSLATYSQDQNDTYYPDTGFYSWFNNNNNNNMSAYGYGLGVGYGPPIAAPYTPPSIAFSGINNAWWSSLDDQTSHGQSESSASQASAWMLLQHE